MMIIIKGAQTACAQYDFFMSAKFIMDRDDQSYLDRSLVFGPHTPGLQSPTLFNLLWAKVAKVSLPLKAKQRSRVLRLFPLTARRCRASPTYATMAINA